ncbi:MAG: hypothetical protein A2Z18_07505 [Armatimonadetes bacterium RBG_16_58_9]|nr:MAG: hypothetical protein A2Z18_07505 [Armatimonadetes bacterium RBG_16_58_9]
MEIGKLPPETLSRLLAKAKTDPTVIIGPAYGEDAAAIRFGSSVLVAASDPVTFTTDRIGYYAVCVNANDIAVTGATPRYFLATILLPDRSSESDAAGVFDQISEACEEIGVTLIGGHTEVTGSVDRIVVAGTMLGDAREESLISSAGARVGDGIILAGPIAIEGTTILAREARDDLLGRGVSESLISNAESVLDKYGICVLNYARAAMSTGAVTAMHDPTEGGLATAIRELTFASKTGALISSDAIPILSECRAICDALALEPLGLIASGCLLVTVPANMVEETVMTIERTGAPVNIIGLVRDPEHGVTFEGGSSVPMYDRDEIARYFSSVNTATE